MAIKAAIAGGKKLMKHYGDIDVKYKPDGSLVTQADIESGETIKTILKKNFPRYSLLGEETGYDIEGANYKWIVDPLDGTTNYSIMNPFFDVSIALAFKKEPILGVVYYPPSKELFYAQKGDGAYLNNKKIFVSKQSDIKNSTIAFCHGRDKVFVKRIISIYQKLKLINNRVRQIGAAALEICFVACGRIDSFFMVGVNLWDVAAGVVIANEAQGIVSDFDGKSFDINAKDVLVSNGKIHEQMLDAINETRI